MSGFDPFDNTDDAPVIEEPETTVKKPATRARKTTTAKKETTPVSETTDNQLSKLSITLKGGSGFDAPWVVIYPGSWEEAAELLGLDAADYTDKLDLVKAVLDAAQKASQYFISKGAQKPAAATNNSGQGNGGGNRQAAPQGATEHPQGKREYCDHGEMRYKSGFSGPNAKTPNKPYQMFVCTAPRESQCRPKNA